MPKEIENEDNDSADSILRIGAVEVEEELDRLSGYHEYIREQFRLNED